MGAMKLAQIRLREAHRDRFRVLVLNVKFHCYWSMDRHRGPPRLVIPADDLRKEGYWNSFYTIQKTSDRNLIIYEKCSQVQSSPIRLPVPFFISIPYLVGVSSI